MIMSSYFRRSQLESEEIVADLVHCFLIPEVKKKTVREKGRSKLSWFNQIYKQFSKGAQWLSGRVLDSRPRAPGFEPHLRHCVVVLEQDTFILA